MLEATFQILPEEPSSRWKGNLCVDATLIRGWGKDGSPTSDARNLTRDISQDLMSPDIDSGWYYRDADHREPPHTPGRTQPKRAWGNEAHLAVMTANDPTVTPDYPLLVLGISFDLPAGRVGENAMTAIRSIIERGHPAGFFVADRAYLFNSIPSKLQLPSRALGYQLCGDYRDAQLGLQGSHNCANLVEGNWYSPSMPGPRIEATRHTEAQGIGTPAHVDKIERWYLGIALSGTAFRFFQLEEKTIGFQSFDVQVLLKAEDGFSEGSVEDRHTIVQHQCLPYLLSG